MSKIVYVKTIGTCNLNCNHCFTNGSSGDKTQFDIDVTTKWLDDYINEVGVDNDWHIELHGGEPFLVKIDKLTSFTKPLREKYPGISIGATTNLTYPITSKHIKFFKEELNNQIATSWDPFIRWTSDKQFKLWSDNIKLVQSHGIVPRVNVSMSRQLMDEYDPERLIKTFEELDIRYVELERLTLGGNAQYSPDIFPGNDYQDKWFLELVKYYQSCDTKVVIETIDNMIARLESNLVHTGTNCRNCEQNLVTINSNGTLSTCPNVAEAINYANIKEPPAVFLTHDARVESQAKEQDIPMGCLTCDVFDICGGDCHQLPFDGRCGGYKRTLHYLSNRPFNDNIILRQK